VKEKTKKAVALKYKSEQNAPEVVAKGERKIAERILKIAEEAGIHIEKDADLVNVLFKLDLYEEIPEYLYSVVAEILAYVYVVKKRWESRKEYENR